MSTFNGEPVSGLITFTKEISEDLISPFAAIRDPETRLWAITGLRGSSRSWQGVLDFFAVGTTDEGAAVLATVKEH